MATAAGALLVAQAHSDVAFSSPTSSVPSLVSEDVDYDKAIGSFAIAASEHDRASEILFNTDPARSVILTKWLLLVAKREVCILSGFLHPLIYGDREVLSAVRAFLLRPDTKLRVALDHRGHQGLVNFDPESNPFAREISNFSNAEIRHVPESVAELYPFHFLVADQKSYRFEQDRDKEISIARYCDPEIANLLYNRFRDIWRFAT